MECNKDEAIRAKDIAEKKMVNNDFEGAQKMAKRAQSIYPELENLVQLTTICNVHCSSQKRILGSDKDWYAILQVDWFADQLTIKKQYRRLALFLHPDKNRFPGAESAFKLICEANAVLSDPVKKSLYDNKIKVYARSALANAPTRNIKKKDPQFINKSGSHNQNQAAQSSSSTRLDAFWTACPFCRVKCQYERKFMNMLLSCPKCSVHFMAYEESAEGVSSESKQGQHGARPMTSKSSFSQPAAFPVKENQANFKMDTGFRKAKSSSFTATHGIANTKPVQHEPEIQKKSCSGAAKTESVARSSRDSKAKARAFCTVNLSNGHMKGKMCNVDVGARKLDQKSRGTKRGWKQAAESHESLDELRGSDARNLDAEVGCGDTATEMDSGHVQVLFPQRSSRKRQHVIYHENDGDLTSTHQASHERKLPEDGVEEQNNALDGKNSKECNQNSSPTDVLSSKLKGKQMETVHPVGKSRPKGANNDYDVKARRRTGAMPRTGADTAEKIKHDSGKDSYSTFKSDGGLYEVPDPEFGDFDKDRDESVFAVDQIWACYDTADGMPRFYAKVKKILKSPFGLRFTWFEADPEDEPDKRWIDEGLPVGCGRYELGRTEETRSLLSFSHKMCCERGQKRGSFLIYPREGETWAIFKDWSITWNSVPDNHAFKYEIVEVLSDFVSCSGIEVCHLDKVRGFVSLFQRTSQIKSFFVGPRELYRFSHRIPCFKMTGHETAGVPEGSFELDPASLPLNPENLYYSGKATMEQDLDHGVDPLSAAMEQDLDHGVDPLSAESAKRRGKTMVFEHKCTAKDSLEGIDSESLKLRRSPRKLNITGKKGN
ncbi:hypothetical protein F511_00932 [Dorcoceras hygrometricum]|nr:hypothetical protein F511_00932 [Dorcoceras hygrometricum]